MLHKPNPEVVIGSVLLGLSLHSGDAFPWPPTLVMIKCSDNEWVVEY